MYVCIKIYILIYVTHNGILFSHENEGDPAICNTWKDLEGIIISERKSDRERLYDFTCRRILKRAKLTEIESKMVVTRGWGGGIKQLLVKGYKFPVRRRISSEIQYTAL